MKGQTFSVNDYVSDATDAVAVITTVFAEDECACLEYAGIEMKQERYFCDIVPVIVVARPIEGCSLNGREFALDEDGNYFGFIDEGMAKAFLQTRGGVDVNDLDNYEYIRATADLLGKVDDVKFNMILDL